MKIKIEQFNILRVIGVNPKTTQRVLSSRLNMSLGKVNYCLKALNQKGLIKMVNFNKKNNKLEYINNYLLTKKGIKYRLDLTYNFMKLKMTEYNELKKDIKKLKNKNE